MVASSVMRYEILYLKLELIQIVVVVGFFTPYLKGKNTVRGYIM